MKWVPANQNFIILDCAEIDNSCCPIHRPSFASARRRVAGRNIRDTSADKSECREGHREKLCRTFKNKLGGDPSCKDVLLTNVARWRSAQKSRKVEISKTANWHAELTHTGVSCWSTCMYCVGGSLLLLHVRVDSRRNAVKRKTFSLERLSVLFFAA